MAYKNYIEKQVNHKPSGKYKQKPNERRQARESFTKKDDEHIRNWLRHEDEQFILDEADNLSH